MAIQKSTYMHREIWKQVEGEFTAAVDAWMEAKHQQSFTDIPRKYTCKWKNGDEYEGFYEYIDQAENDERFCRYEQEFLAAFDYVWKNFGAEYTEEFATMADALTSLLKEGDALFLDGYYRDFVNGYDDTP